MPAPRLSIIIATWNAAGTFERCICSIMNQSFPGWELLVSDGESTDGTVELIQKYSQCISWWRSGKDAGIYDAWNRALEHANGDYICFLGADDAWENEGVLAELFSAIGEKQFDLVTSRGRMIDPSTARETTFGSPWNFKRIGRRMVVCHPGLLHHRSLFDRYGLFDAHYRIAGDLEFLLRMPADLVTLDVATTTVTIELAGVSRKNVMARLREQRIALSRCARYGPARAWTVWLDKLWRYPIAQLLGISH